MASRSRGRGAQVAGGEGRASRLLRDRAVRRTALSLAGAVVPGAGAPAPRRDPLGGGTRGAARAPGAHQRAAVDGLADRAARALRGDGGALADLVDRAEAFRRRRARGGEAPALLRRGDERSRYAAPSAHRAGALCARGDRAGVGHVRQLHPRSAAGGRLPRPLARRHGGSEPRRDGAGRRHPHPALPHHRPRPRLAAAVLLFALLSRRKAIASVLVLVAAAGMMLFAPTSFWERNETSTQGAEDLSI